MDFRTKRQAAVFTAAVLILAGIGLLAYLANRPPPSCFDRTYNQNEEEVDCGGPCAPCALRYGKPLEIFWVRFVQVRPNSYDVAAEVYNSNQKLGAASFAYTFTLFNLTGEVAAERRSTAFAYPRETVHLAEVGLIADDPIRNVTVTLTDPQWVLTESVPPDLVASRKAYGIAVSDGLRRSSVTAALLNRSVRDIADVGVSVFLSDERGNLMGVHRTVLEGLPAGVSRPLTFVWPHVFPVAPTGITVEARSPALLSPPAE